MDIEQILADEDKMFYARSDGVEISEETSGKSKKKKNSPATEEDIRDDIIGMLSNPVSEESAYTQGRDKANNFPRGMIKQSITKLLVDNGYNPSNPAEIQAISSFITNLESISRMAK